MMFVSEAMFNKLVAKMSKKIKKEDLFFIK